MKHAYHLRLLFERIRSFARHPHIYAEKQEGDNIEESSGSPVFHPAAPREHRERSAGRVETVHG